MARIDIYDSLSFDAEYMQILKMWGNGRCCGYGVDGVMRMCVIRGNMRKKVWIQPGDYVLVSVPEYQKEKCFIVNKYSPDEVRTLRSMSEIPESFKGVTGRETFEDKLADELLDNIHFADDEDRSDSEDTVDIAEV